MVNDTAAGIGRGAAPQLDLNYMDEYLMKLRGVDYIPLRKHRDYKLNGMNNPRSNFISPRMEKMNKSRKAGNK